MSDYQVIKVEIHEENGVAYADSKGSGRDGFCLAGGCSLLECRSPVFLQARVRLQAHLPSVEISS